MSNIVYLPSFGRPPVQNSPMRKGPKPKGTLSFHAARKRKTTARLLERARTQAAAKRVDCQLHAAIDGLRDDEAREVLAKVRQMKWPFSFDRSLWDDLPARDQKEVEEAFRIMLIGAKIMADRAGRS